MKEPFTKEDLDLIRKLLFGRFKQGGVSSQNGDTNDKRRNQQSNNVEILHPSKGRNKGLDE